MWVMGMLIFCSVLCVGLLAYRQHWKHCFRRPARDRCEVLRFEGVVAGPDDVFLAHQPGMPDPFSCAGPFEFEHAEGKFLVDPTYAVLDGGWRLRRHRPLVKGQRLTIDGVLVHRPQQEVLYRESGCTAVIDAVRIVRGTWSMFRWLAAPIAAMGICCVILIALQLTDNPVWVKTARVVRCPSGTSLATTPTFPTGWIHWCRTGDGTRHGPWIMYHKNGRKKRQAHYSQGLLHGRYMEWHLTRENWKEVVTPGAIPAWIMMGTSKIKGRYAKGRKHGLWVRRDSEGYKVEQGRYFMGQKVGHWTSWSNLDINTTDNALGKPPHVWAGGHCFQ